MVTRNPCQRSSKVQSQSTHALPGQPWNSRSAHTHSGEPRLQEFSWSSCKPAKYRDEEFSVFKDKLGRKPKSSAPSAPPGFPASTPSVPPVNASPVATSSPAKASSVNASPVATSSSASGHQGPVIPNDVFDDLSPGVTSGFVSPPSATGRPVRSTRNKKPVRFKD